ncbi:MAG: response regulator transcription factor [Pirellulales bacterium]|nr:response regulator transcription factor [Pirellulales bacterium]
MTRPGEPTVFLLDDDPAARQAIAAMTRSLEMPLEIVASADDFLDKFDPARPGCLVVEVHSPGIKGLELLEKLRAAGVFFAAVAVSAKADAAAAVRAMRAGAIDFLAKPLDEERLWSALQEALQRDAEYRRRQAQVERIRRRMERLNEGELAVLELMQAGKPNREIAESLKLSVRAVEVRRAKIMEKMKVSSLAELLRNVILLEFFS